MPINYTNKNVYNYVCNLLKIEQKEIKIIKLIKKSIDARKKPKIYYSLCVGVELINKNKEEKLNYEQIILDYSGLEYNKINSVTRPVVVGFGPSGMFCALALAKMGLRPIVIEQGSCVEQRKQQVESFWNSGKLNPNSNVQFGEGGAGTFSDGKLNTNLNNEYCKKVMNELYLHGAPEQILYDSKPHIGSDKLCDVVKNIRQDILALGGEIFFDTKLVDILIQDNQVKEIEIKNLKDNTTKTITSQYVCLCLGHSARDTFKLLKRLGQNISQKPFAMGVRIEQKADDVNVMQYGKNYDKSLPNANYKLVSHLPNGRSMFTFCMCPGGVVVASSSFDGEIVTNGMSYFSRNGKNSNSALLINVVPSDYQSDDPLAGIYFQEKYEKLAYKLGGGNFCAPVQTVGSFLDNKQNIGECSYKPNYKFTQIKDCMPTFVYESLKLGIKDFNKKYPGFAKDDDVLVAIESRSSCPLCLVRDENMQSNIKGIFPCGEGAGYAGGIVSSAQDGIKTAEAIYKLIKE